MPLRPPMKSPLGDRYAKGLTESFSSRLLLDINFYLNDVRKLRLR